MAQQKTYVLRIVLLFQTITLIAIRFSLLLTLLLLEFQAAVMHHSSCQLVDAHFLISSEAQDVNGRLKCKVT